MSTTGRAVVVQAVREHLLLPDGTLQFEVNETYLRKDYVFSRGLNPSVQYRAKLTVPNIWHFHQGSQEVDKRVLP